jgi:hypothetical protein
MLVAVCLVLCLPASLGSVKIDFIELFENDRVLIHFDTEANRSYQLQYTETLTNGVPAGNWTNLFVAPSTPFPGHYVIVDTRLRPQRFYRLRVLP